MARGALAFILWAVSWPAMASPTLYFPVEKQVLQRNETTGGVQLRIQIQRAYLNLKAVRVTVHAQTDIVQDIPIASGTENPLTLNGPFVPQGGWYSLDVVQYESSSWRSAASHINRFGVGDVYVIAGQSNAASWMEAKTTSKSGMTTMWDPTQNIWSQLQDPMPFTDGNGGSYWPEVGDLLAQASGYPIGFVNTAIGGTLVEQWQKGKASDAGIPLYDRLLKVVNTLDAQSGFRMILWYQGEGDLGRDATYRGLFLQLAHDLEADSHSSVRWMVGLATYSPFDTGAANCSGQPNSALRQVLMNLDDGVRIFRGADGDDLGGDYRYSGPTGLCIHFGKKAQPIMAERWLHAITRISVGA